MSMIKKHVKLQNELTHNSKEMSKKDILNARANLMKEAFRAVFPAISITQEEILAKSNNPRFISNKLVNQYIMAAKQLIKWSEGGDKPKVDVIQVLWSKLNSSFQVEINKHLSKVNKKRVQSEDEVVFPDNDLIARIVAHRNDIIEQISED